MGIKFESWTKRVRRDKRVEKGKKGVIGEEKKRISGFNRAGFTMIELIISLIIMAIISLISFDILRKVYRNYVITREVTRLNLKTETILSILASKLQNRLKNSIIGVECNVTNGDCEAGNVIGFKPVAQIRNDERDKYPVLEWIEVDRTAKIGIWNDSIKNLEPGWSGFIDLRQTQYSTANDDCKNYWTIVTPYSNSNIVQQVVGNYLKQWGVEGAEDVFGNWLVGLVFGGPGGRGTLSDDFNSSYGYYQNWSDQIYMVVEINGNQWKICRPGVSDEERKTRQNVKIFQTYYLVKGGGAIVPVTTGNGEFNLTYRFNYFPWLDQKYTDGNSTIIGDHITFFQFKEEQGNLRLYLCITSDNIDLKEYNLTVCKEKVVF